MSVEWVQKTLSPSVSDDDRSFLFCDNLTAQVSDEFKESVSELNGAVLYELPNVTDLCQPVDAGYAQIKRKMQESGMATTILPRPRKEES